jgi:P27 family predicted phage terminase small subunit
MSTAVPTAIKKLNGNPGGRPLNNREPAFKNKKPIAPKEITENEKAFTQWKRLVKLLWPTGVLTQGETDLLTTYCFVYAQWVEAVEDVSKSGTVIMNSKGDVKINPSFTVSNALTIQMRKLQAELGMTPSARARIQVNKVDDKDSLESYLQGAYEATHELESIENE